jgi:hypothetical membrane protein
MLSALAITLFGIVWLASPPTRVQGLISLILVGCGFATAVIPNWDGVAIPETVGAAVVFIWVYMVIWQTYPELIPFTS